MRGLMVLVSWVVWPPLFYALYWIANVMLATGRRCSIEGCDGPDGFAGLLWIAAMVGPPLFLTYRWWRWRGAGSPSA